MLVIDVEMVSKSYPARRGARAMLGRGGLGDLLGRRPKAVFTALEEITFQVEAGESLGIIGRNGSGKSTLLKLLAGVSLPSSGRVRVEGRVASLLELGAGFHPMLTGRENIYLNAGLLGMTRSEVEGVFEEIVAFSGIAEFLDQPVETYSSGMYVRIAFSVAVHANPDIFLVDEVLAVGDENFQRQCRAKIGALRESGKTIVFVSHDLGLVHALCSRVILLSGGKVVSRETPQATIDYYLRQVGQAEGIHSLSQAGHELLFSHGRMSYFYEQEEVTAPAGMELEIVSLGRGHSSKDMEWRLVERAGDHCIAEGVMPRLPISLRWSIVLKGGRICWSISLHASQGVQVDRISAQLFFSARYSQWYYGDESGAFAPLDPEHQQWSSSIPASPACHQALFYGAPGTPALAFSLQGVPQHCFMEIANSDYMRGARAVSVFHLFPATDEGLPAGDYDFGDIEIALLTTPAQRQDYINAMATQQSLTNGAVCCRLHEGALALYWREELLSVPGHLQSQIKVGNLWMLSSAWTWTKVESDEQGLAWQGASPRFPGLQHWTLSRTDQAQTLLLEIDISCPEPTEIQEFNISLTLPAAYSHWDTGHEQGLFPAITPADQEWRHVNRNYAPGKELSACGVGLPKVVLRVAQAVPNLHMTVLNTGAAQQGRVLQLLRSASGASPWILEAGRHRILAARLVLKEEDPTHD